MQVANRILKKINLDSLKFRLSVLMVLLTLLPLLIVGWMVHSFIIENIRADRIKIVGRVADSKRDQLVMVLIRANARAESFLSNLASQCKANGTSLNKPCATELLESYMVTEKALGAILQRRGQSEHLAVGTAGRQLAAIPQFQAGQLAQFAGNNPEHNQSYFISIIESHSGWKLAISYPSSNFDEVFNSPVELGTSGETFLADGEGYFVTHARYPSKQGHFQPISAYPMRTCLNEKSTEVLDLDYRDVPIIHGFRFIPELGAACIMAHIDQTEAFAPINKIERDMAIVGLTLLLFSLASYLYFARRITKPLSELTNAVQSYANGKQSVKVSVAGNDEIAVLSKSFNSMTAKLNHLDSHLQQEHTELIALNHELEEAQSHMLQSEKMASIGQLAAGVAHEINNPIGYVYSNLGTLEKYVQDAFGMLDQYEQAESAITDAEIRAKLKAAKDKLDFAFLRKDLRALMDESKDGITRVKQIVQNLKDFSHVDTSEEWHYTNLHSGLDSTLNIVNNEIKYKANVIKEYGELPEVECLSSQLNQVFMNLLVNAAHAIEQRGTITIRTGQQGDEVWVDIADTGKGIAPEHIKKIFDPFFTTKPVGKGTGLGLSLSYSIIQKHHGRIEVQSEIGKGTTFRVWLPIKQPQAGQA